MPISINGTTGAITGMVSASSTDLSTSLAAKVSATGQTGTVNLSGATLTGAGLDLIATNTFSTASSVSINNCFSSTYNNYKIIIDCTTTIAGGVDFQYRLRSAGSDLSSSSYYYGHIYMTASGGPTRGYGGPVTLGYMGYIGDLTGIMSMDITSPFLSKTKSMHCQYSGPGTSQAYYGSLYTLISSSTSCDGITIYPSSGTTTGTIRIYGYRNS